MATDSVRRRGECHLGLAPLFFTPSLGVAEVEGLLVLGGVLELELEVEVVSPAPPSPPAVRSSGVAGLVSSLTF
jgi:hypothetical protein